jgi:hypothetical protein
MAHRTLAGFVQFIFVEHETAFFAFCRFNYGAVGHLLQRPGQPQPGFMTDREHYHQALDEVILLCLKLKPHAEATNNTEE